MIHGTSNAATIASTSAEWVLLSAIYHYVLARSPSPEFAKIAIANALENNQLRLRAEVREHEAGPRVILRPGEPVPEIPPKCKPDQTVLPSEKFDTWDWERSYATKIDRTTKSLFEYVNIEGNRADVLKLWPAAVTSTATERPTKVETAAAKPADLSALVWAVVLTLDQIEKETPNGLWGFTQTQLADKIGAKLPRRPSLRTIQKAVAARRKREKRQ